jgi:hypothetical protein
MTSLPLLAAQPADFDPFSLGPLPSPGYSCTPGMGDNLEVKVLCGRWSDEPLAKGNCASVSKRGEEARRQTLDSMDKNCVRRHRKRGKLARDSEARKDQSGLCKRSEDQGKGIAPYPGRSAWSAGEAEVSRGHSSRWSNDHPRRAGKPGHRAKGRTVEELSRKEKDDGRVVESWQDQTGRSRKAEGQG